MKDKIRIYYIVVVVVSVEKLKQPLNVDISLKIRQQCGVDKQLMNVNKLKLLN